MRKSVHSRQYRVFIDCLVAARKAADLTQQELAEQLRKPQSFVAKYETGERRLDVVEFLQIAEKLRADPHAILRETQAAR